MKKFEDYLRVNQFHGVKIIKETLFNHSIMRKTIASLFALIIATAGFSQASVCDDANITSWQINTDGTTAQYLTDCCPQSGSETLVLMDDTAGVKQVWYNTNNVYILSESLAYSDMGSWPTLKIPTAQGLSYKIPREVTEDLSGDENTANSGTIGVAINGVLIFAETTSNSYNNANGDNVSGDGIWNEDAWLDEAWSMDSASGHSNNSGQYHYHTAPVLLFGDISEGHSPIIGWGLDGVPIYGPYGYVNPNDVNSPVVRIRTGYELRMITDRTELDGETLDPSEYGPELVDYELGTYVEDFEFTDAGHLDEHNGRWCKTPEYPDGIYAYFTTLDAAGDPEYPYYIGPEFYGERPNGQAGATIANNANQYDPFACVTSSTDISESSAIVSTFPNPTKGTLNVEIGAENSVYISAILTDVYGNELERIETNGRSLDATFSLNRESGIYFIRATVGDEVIVRSVVKD